MREIGRVQQGYFPTQDRIIQLVSDLFKFPSSHNGTISVLDAGCGTGQAIYDLRAHWLKRCNNLNVSLLGIESDKSRFTRTQELFAGIEGRALWAAIEDSWLDQPVSLLWFNPPYDRIRGAGRLELSLFNAVKEWPSRETGLLLLIVPDHVLADADVGLAVAIERHYEMLGLWRYPEPEYSEFKQCVLIGRRRGKALDKTRLGFPSWAENPDGWPILKDGIRPVAEITALPMIPKLYRSRLGTDVINDAVSQSPLRGSMLREATAAAPKIGRPLLPLKNGHLALALAGGLCDGVIQSNGEKFLIKGTLTSVVRKTGMKEQFDSDGEKTAEIDIFKTRYEMNVRCLRESGEIEDYSSADPDAETLTTTNEPEEDT